MVSFVVKSEESGQTLEKYLRKVLPEAPLSFVYKLFRKKDVKVNGHWQTNKYIINSSDVINVYITDIQLEEFKRKYQTTNLTNITNWIIYEDKNVLLVNKPRGVLVQKDTTDSLALDDMVLSYLINKGEFDPNKDLAYKPAPTHRLDRNTAGIVMFGKNIETLRYLSTVMNDKEKIQKHYLTLVKGMLDKDGIIEAPLKKNSKTSLVMVDKEGKPSITKYRVNRNIGNYTLLDVQLVTGRTHQIRVHMQHINHPIIGDNKYGDFALNREIEQKYGFKNQFLIAYQLDLKKLDNPLQYLSGKSFTVDLCVEMQDLLDKLAN